MHNRHVSRMGIVSFRIALKPINQGRLTRTSGVVVLVSSYCLWRVDPIRPHWWSFRPPTRINTPAKPLLSTFLYDIIIRFSPTDETKSWARVGISFSFFDSNKQNRTPNVIAQRTSFHFSNIPKDTHCEECFTILPVIKLGRCFMVLLLYKLCSTESRFSMRNLQAVRVYREFSYLLQNFHTVALDMQAT